VRRGRRTLREACGLRIFCGLRRDYEFAIGVDAVANLAQVAEDAAADRDFVACAEMAEIKTMLGYGGDAGGGGWVDAELFERTIEGNARRGDFIGVHHYIALNASSFFARERDFVCELRFGFTAHAVGPAENGASRDQKDKPRYDSEAIHCASVFPSAWPICRITQGRKARKAELR
jgi:hypothetical protein